MHLKIVYVNSWFYLGDTKYDSHRISNHLKCLHFVRGFVTKVGCGFMVVQLPLDKINQAICTHP